MSAGVCLLGMLLVACGANAQMPKADLTRLGHPAVADRLELTDQQRTDVARLLNARAQALVTTDPTERGKIIENVNRELLAVLTDDQRKSLDAMQTPRKLEFNFTGAKWSDVLSWFAEQADLTLVYDKLPEQEFNYRDDQGYSTSEAIDVLNGVLLSKGFTLIRRGKLLVAADISNRVPDELLPEVNQEDLGKYGHFEFVKTRFALGKRPVEVVQTEVNSLVSDPGRIAVLPATKQLIVVETAGKMTAIGALIASIPEPQKKPPPAPPKPKKAPAPVLAVYPYKNVDPEAVQHVLSQLLGATQSSIDRTARTITVYATPAHQEVFKTTIAQLEGNSAMDRPVDLKSYEIDTGSVEHVRGLLAKLAPAAQILVDPDTRRVTVLGTATEQAAVARAIKALQSDAANDRGEPSLRAYRLKHADPGNIADILQSTVTEATIAASTLTNSIVVRAKPQTQTKIGELVSEMDQPDPTEDATQVQLYPLATDEQAGIVAAITQLYPSLSLTYDDVNERLVVLGDPQQQSAVSAVIERLATRSPRKNDVRTYEVDPTQQTSLIRVISSLAPKADVTWDDANRRLVVIGADDIQSTVAEIISRLTTDTKPLKKELRLYPVDADQQDSIVKLLTSTAPDASVTWDPTNERLVVLAQPSDHDEVATVIEKLTAERRPKTERELRVYTFPPSSQTRATALVDNATATDPEITTVDRSVPGELAIMATEAQHVRLAQLFQQLKQQTLRADRLVLQAYPILKADPDSLLSVITELFPDNKTVLNAESRRLMVWATKDRHADVKQAIAQLDVDAPIGKLQKFVTYDAPGLELTNLLDMLRTQQADMVLSTAPAANKILAWGTNEDHEKLAAKLAQLREENPPAKALMRTYPAAPRTPDEIIPLLTAVVPSAMLTGDAKSNTVIVRATEAEHELIQATLDKLPSPDDAGHKRQLLSYPVDAAQGTDVLTLLSTVTPRATIQLSSDGRKVFVYGTAAEHEQVGTMVEKLASGDTQLERQLKVHKVPADQIAAVSAILPSLVASAEIVETAADRITVWAVVADHEKIDALIHSFGNIKSPQSELAIYEIPAGQLAVVTTLLPTVAPNAVVATPAADQLTVWALPTDHRRIEQLIVDTKSSTKPDNVVQLHKVPPRHMTAITTLLPTVAPNAVVANQGEDEVTLWATPAEHATVARLIEQAIVDQTAETPTRFQVYPLETASGPDLLELLGPERQSGIQIEISGDGERLIVRATDQQHDALRAKLPELIKQLGEDEEIVNRVYRPQVVTLRTLVDVFDDLFPSVPIAVDTAGHLVSVSAYPRVHKQLQQIFDELEKGQSSRPTAKRFPVKGGAGDIENALQRLLRRQSNVSIMASDDGNSILVAAPQREIELISKLIEEFDAEGPAENSVVEVYRISEQSARAVERVLQANLSAAAVVEGDTISQSVLVRAPVEDQVKARSIVDKLNTVNSRETKTYRLVNSDPEVVEEMFDELAPRGDIVNNRANRTITVVARPHEHEEMARVLAQLEQGTSQSPIPKTYVAGEAAAEVFEAAQAVFAESDKVKISWKPGSDSILAVAPPNDHATLAKIVDEFTQRGGLSASDKLVIYPLKDIDGSSARDSLEALLSLEEPPPRLQFDPYNNQMLTIATPAQHQLISDALSRMKRERRLMEFFQLQANDAFSMKMSIEGLFRDLPENARPNVESNDETQQIVVRANEDQMTKIREFLNRMGEVAIDPSKSDTRTTRVIPFYGDLRASIEQMEEIWPRFRRNKLQVVYPADYQQQGILKTLPGTTPAEQNLPGRQPQPSPTPVPQSQVSETQESEIQAGVTADSVTADEDPSTGDQPPDKLPSQETDPPVIVIPGEGRLTIRSDDPEALNEFETLLRMFGARDRSPSSDVAIYGLRNAGANEISKMLKLFFEELPTWSRLGPVIVVPDTRLNAVVVHASPAGREVIRSILAVLDSDHKISDAQQSKPRIVPVQKTSASRILTVLQTIYKTQLATGGGRPQIDIPTGVSDDVAAVLEQINSSSVGPLLTLEVDETTNSVIVLAPLQLADEVESLIHELDQGAADSESRGLRVISLRNIRSELLQDVLQELINKGS